MTTSSSSPAVLQALRSPRRLTTEVLAGAVTTLALIPEVISFSVIAGVDPKVSLIASVVLAISMTFLGGRPAMITAAAGAVALVVAPLVHTHGVEYLLPTVLLAGIIQILFGVLGLALALVTLAVWRRMEHKAPIRVSGKMVLCVLVGIAGALGLGIGMCFSMLWGKMAIGIVLGLAGIAALIALIPLTKGIGD